MKKSRYSESQIMNILKQAEAEAAVPELCREHGMSSASFYKWRSKYGGMDASMMVRMKQSMVSDTNTATCRFIVIETFAYNPPSRVARKFWGHNTELNLPKLPSNTSTAK